MAVSSFNRVLRSFQGVRATAALVACPSRSLSGSADGPKERAASYYEVVDSVRYDRAALQAAREAVSGKGDGRVSVADTEKILAELVDGNGITKIEYRTAFKILADYPFTDEAKLAFIAQMAKSK
jgi:photosystem II Psb27 protein